MTHTTTRGFTDWLYTLQCRFGTGYELRSGYESLLIYVNDELVAGFSNITGMGWVADNVLT